MDTFREVAQFVNHFYKKDEENTPPVSEEL